MADRDTIAAVQQRLETAMENGTITEKGLETLNRLRSQDKGTFSDSFSTFLQGVVPGTDEAIGAIRQLRPEVKQVAEDISGLSRQDITPRAVGTEMERRPVRRFREESPGWALATEMAGSAIPTAAGAALNLSPQGLMKRGLLTGVGGALYGFGQGEDARERSAGAVLGGGLGLGMGFALPAAGRLLKAPVSRGMKAVFQTPTGYGTRAARKMYRKAIEASGNSIEEAIQKVASMGSGRSYTLSEIGPNTQAYLDFAAHSVGTAKDKIREFLRKRGQGRIARLNGDLEKAFGKDGRYFEEFDALKQVRKTQGDELYNRAFYAPSQGAVSRIKRHIPITDEFTALLNRPIFKHAWKTAKRLAAQDGRPIPDNIQLTANGFEKVSYIPGKSGQKPQVIRQNVKSVDTELLHWIKLGVDDVLYKAEPKAIKTSGAGPTEYKFMVTSKDMFLSYIEGYNPHYKAAREVWSGDSSMMGAMQEGLDLFKLRPDEIAGSMKNMTKGERAAWQSGAMQALINRLDDGVAGTNVLRDLQKGRYQKLFRLTFPPGKEGERRFKKWYSSVGAELEMYGTERGVYGQSATLPRAQVRDQITESLFGALPETHRGPTEAMWKAVAADFEGYEATVKDALAQEFARISTETDPALLRQIQKELTGKNVRQVLQRRLPKLLAILPRYSTSIPALSAVSGIEQERLQAPVGGALHRASKFLGTMYPPSGGV